MIFLVFQDGVVAQNFYFGVSKHCGYSVTPFNLIHYEFFRGSKFFSKFSKICFVDHKKSIGYLRNFIHQHFYPIYGRNSTLLLHDLFFFFLAEKGTRTLNL